MPHLDGRNGRGRGSEEVPVGSGLFPGGLVKGVSTAELLASLVKGLDEAGEARRRVRGAGQRPGDKADGYHGDSDEEAFLHNPSLSIDINLALEHGVHKERKEPIPQMTRTQNLRRRGGRSPRGEQSVRWLVEIVPSGGISRHARQPCRLLRAL